MTPNQCRWMASSLAGGCFAALATSAFAPEITAAGRGLGLGLALAAGLLAVYWVRQIPPGGP